MDRKAESLWPGKIPVNPQNVNKEHRINTIGAPFSDAIALWQMSSLEDTQRRIAF